MKKNLINKLAIAVALSASLTATAQAVTLKLSHVRPQATAIDMDAKQFAEDIKAATDGKVKVKIYAASALGDYTVVQERVSLGAVDMAVQPPASGVDNRFQIVYMPYLVKSWDDAQKVFAKGSSMRQTVAELYDAQNITVLGAWPVYFGGVSLNKEIENAADPTVNKGAKLRVPPIKTFQLTADNIGFIGSPLPFSEAFTAVQTGVVDGVMGSGAEGYYASFRDVTKSYLPINTHFEMWYLIINKDVFNEMNDDQRAKLETAADKFEATRWENARADQTKNEQLLEKAGATIVPVSEAQIEAHAKIVREKVWPEIINDIGAEWAQGVLDEALK